MRVLILGGTAEARQLATKVARDGMTVTLSLAGRTASPVAAPVPIRVGGFGGAEGLAEYLIRHGIDALIDATHPYASVISSNAATAARMARVPALVLHRPPWSPVAGDRWVEVGDTVEAVKALGPAPRRVFVALGRNELSPLVAAPQHFYLVRSVDPIEPPLPVPDAAYITARGPFAESDERALLAQHRIATIIAKNSGGTATYGKIAAARALALPIIMLRRPPPADIPTVTRVEDAVAWVDHGASRAARGV